MIRKRIKVMAEYGSSGIFGLAPIEMVGMLSCESLGLSAELADDFGRWVGQSEAWLDMDDPRRPVEVPAAEEAAWLAEGKQLTERLQAELGEEWEVVYWHEGGRL